jgi:hypothetical protein
LFRIFEQSHVSLLLSADYLGRVPAVVLKVTVPFVGVGDDVVVDYDVPGGSVMNLR